VANLLNPIFLKDSKYKAVEKLLENLHNELIEKTVAELIYPRIDEIEDEQLLDLLGWQFHIEGWELAKTIEDKRRLIKSAIELHRYKGTPYAIKKVLEALGLSGDIKEWFEYGGEPYKFKIDLGIQNREITPELRDKLIRLINEYKNERSWLDELILSYLAKGAVYYGAGAVGEVEQNGEFVRELSQTAIGHIYHSAGAVGEVECKALMEV